MAAGTESVEDKIGNNILFANMTNTAASDHPGDSDNYFLEGNSHREAGRPLEAIRMYQASLAINPKQPLAYANLGSTAWDIGQWEMAIWAYQRGAELAPDMPEMHLGLGTLFAHGGAYGKAMEALRKAIEIDSGCFNAHHNLLTFGNYFPMPPEQRFADAERFGAEAKKRAVPFPSRGRDVGIDRERPLRVGLVSADLRRHPVAYFLLGVLREMQGFDFFAYSNHQRPDSFTDQFKSACFGWRDVLGMPDRELADNIQRDRIDILIDLSGHTAGTRLPVFAWKPAPIQISWLGYFASTGLDEMDFLIADRSLGVEEEQFFT
ncbi:MAG TPA: tetratricopeptide repeat protein, partial [Burkholderiaceae bacterium]